MFAGVFVVILVLGIVNWRSNAFLASSADHIGEVLSPAIFMARSIHTAVAEAHIKIEEIMGGDDAESQSEVFSMIAGAEEMLAAIGKSLDPSDAALVSRPLSLATDALERLQGETRTRFATLSDTAVAGSGDDERFDQLYESLVKTLETASADPGLASDPEAQRTIGDARFAIADGHLLLEEVLGGDATESVNDAMARFTAADDVLSRMTSLPSADALRAQLAELTSLAKSRYETMVALAQTSAADDARFDAVYSDFQNAVSEAISILQARLDGELAGEDRVQAITLAGLVVGSLFLAAVAAGVFLMFKSRILGRVLDVERAMAGLASGAIDTPLPDWESTDEIGSLRARLSIFRDALVERERLAAERRATAEREEAAAREKAAEEAARREAKAQKQERELARQQEVRDAEQRATAEIAKVVQACAEGDFSQRLRLDDKSGVFADLCRGLNDIGASTDTTLGEIRRALEAVAQGDLTYRVSGNHSGIFGEIASATNACAESLGRTLLEIGQSGQKIGDSTSSISESAENLARRSERSAATLEETAAAIGAMATAIAAAEKSADSANRSMAAIGGKTESGTQVVGAAVRAMDELAGSSDSIRNIIEVIDGIAFQTNLLALNAGVEAARAGEAGRGFAVVASEVRALASRSSEASREIAQLIDESGKKVSEGVDLVNQTGQALEEIAADLKFVTDQMSSIAESSKETSARVSELNHAAQQLDQTTQQNVAMFEETTASVKMLQEETETLASAVALFRIDGGAAGSGFAGPDVGPLRKVS